MYPDYISKSKPNWGSRKWNQTESQEKSSWILRLITLKVSYPYPERKYISGETHKYLGKQYQLKVELADNELVKMRPGFIVVKGCDKVQLESGQLLPVGITGTPRKRLMSVKGNFT